jgi:nitrate/nitrite-specific signal transduction histidine kinase
MRIMRERAEALNLTLGVESQLGSGTTVNIAWRTSRQPSAISSQHIGEASPAES